MASSNYPLRAWLQKNGIEVDAARRVIFSLRLLKPDQWQNASLERLVRFAYSPEESYYEALDDSDRKTADALFDALRGARKPLSRGATPAGAVLNEVWWSGDARYVGGRAPMQQMPRLPDEILRHVCDFLASAPAADRDAEGSLLESRQFCADWESLTLRAVEPSVQELNDMGERWGDIHDSVSAGIRSFKPRLAAALQLRAVSSAWSRALLKRTAFLKGRVDRFTFERYTLDDIAQVAGSLLDSLYGP